MRALGGEVRSVLAQAHQAGRLFLGMGLPGRFLGLSGKASAANLDLDGGPCRKAVRVDALDRPVPERPGEDVREDGILGVAEMAEIGEMILDAGGQVVIRLLSRGQSGARRIGAALLMLIAHECLRKCKRPAGCGPWVCELEVRSGGHFLRVEEGWKSAVTGGFAGSQRLIGVLLRLDAAQRRRKPACSGNEALGFDRHLLFLEIGKEARGLFAPGFGDGVQDFSLGYAAEIILSRGREACFAEIEVQHLCELIGVANAIASGIARLNDRVHGHADELGQQRPPVFLAQAHQEIPEIARLPWERLFPSVCPGFDGLGGLRLPRILHVFGRRPWAWISTQVMWAPYE